MRVGIIGSGRIGANIGRRLAGAGHEVLFSYSRTTATLQNLAERTGGQVGSPQDAAQFGEVLVVSVPWDQLPDVLAQAGPLSGTVVVDTTNQYTAQGLAPLPDGQTAAAYNAARMPGARYTKSFNTLTAAFQVDVAGRTGPDRVVQWLCGDDSEAKAGAAQLITDAGYTPVDVGGTKDAAVMEAPRRSGSVYGEEYHLAEAREVLDALAAGRSIPAPPSYSGD
jgi:predicted dinucleotide-binding enzyme